MQFLSPVWLGWMVLTIGLYWLTPLPWRFLTLVVISGAFLAIHDPLSLIILLSLTLWTHAMTCRPKVDGRHCLLTCLLIVGVLGWYKIQIIQDLDIQNLTTAAIPLGLSYYCFRLMHYAIERYKGTVQPAELQEFLAYLFFIPTIVVGPIHRYPQFHKDYHRARLDPALLSEGMERIVFGYAKIAILGNYLINNKFSQYIGSLDSEHVWLVYYLEVVRNGLNLYLQFSGFSDIAIGFARLLGFRVMENFRWPYLQPNISRYWQCWHMSLTSWCREYIYTSVVSITRNPALGAISTLIVIGLWHEASLRYIAWGCYHGLGIVLWQRWQHAKTHLPAIELPILQQLTYGLSVIVTVHFVWLGLVIVTQPDFTAVWRIWQIVLFGWL